MGCAGGRSRFARDTLERIVISMPDIIPTVYRNFQECTKKGFLTAQPQDHNGPGGEISRYVKTLALSQPRYKDFPDLREQPDANPVPYMTDDCPGLLHPTFRDGDRESPCVAHCDAVRREADGWSLVSVEMAMTVAQKHTEKIAFQWMTACDAGAKLNRAVIVHIDGNYVRSQAVLDPDALFRETDVTEDVIKIAAEMMPNLGVARNVLAGGVTPQVDMNVHCRRDAGCEYLATCLGDRYYDVIFLPHITDNGVTALREKGYNTIDQIPADFRLTPTQAQVRNIVSNGVANETLSTDGNIAGVSGKGGLPAVLEGIRYPVGLLDFENLSEPVPPYPGFPPYAKIPFQFCLQRVSATGAEPEEKSYLHREKTDPRQALVEALWKAVQGLETIVVYSGHEHTLITGMANDGITGADALLEFFLPKELDLMQVITDNVSCAAFRGSYSLKVVQPFLAPGAPYHDLDNQNGGDALAMYRKMMGMYREKTDEEVPPDADRLACELIAYCRNDVEVMRLSLERLRTLPLLPA